MANLAGNIPSAPLFSPHIEAKAMEALNVLIVVRSGDNSPVEPSQVDQLQVSVTRLVDCLFPIKGDAAEFAGADVLEGNDYVHPIKVAELAAVMGRTMGRPRSALISLAMAAALMNVGYLTLRRSLLNEPRRLLDGEWEQHVHTHPSQGVALLARSGLSDDCLRAIAEHHERWDGSGYPRGLRGEAISREARILAVADSYVSLRSARPYRHAVDAADALREIAGDGGKLFDPGMVDVFEEVIARYSGVERPERVNQVAAQVSPTSGAEVHEPQRNGTDRAEEDHSKAARDTADELESRAEHARANRSAPAIVEQADARPQPGLARGGAPRRTGGVDPGSAGSVTATPATTVQRAAALPPAPGPGASRRAQPRYRRRTLFSARFYIVGAMRGGWAVD